VKDQDYPLQSMDIIAAETLPTVEFKRGNWRRAASWARSTVRIELVSLINEWKNLE
jgi:hypothetical protein